MLTAVAEACRRRARRGPGGRRRRARRPGLGPRAARLEPRGRPAARARRASRRRQRRGRDRRLRARPRAARSRRRAPATTPRAIASLEDTVLLSTQRMRGVEIDVETRTARVQAGTLWLEVTEASLAARPVPAVGLLARRRRRRLHARRRPELARAQARAGRQQRHRDRARDPRRAARARDRRRARADLFWALRGGGGSFGIVTAMEFRLFPYGEVYAGMFLLPFERAGEVLRAWRDWTRTAPEDVTTSMRVLHLPPLPELPDFLRGRSVAVIDGAFAGERGRGRRGDRGAARARSRARHLGHGPRRRAQPAAHGPGGAGARTSPRRRCWATRRRGARGVRGPRPAGRAAACSPSCATSAARSRACPRARARSARSTPSTSTSTVGIVMGPEAAAAVAAAGEQAGGGAGRVRDGVGVPQLRRAPGRHLGVLHRRRLRAPERDPGRRRPGRLDGRQPPDPGRVVRCPGPGSAPGVDRAVSSVARAASPGCRRACWRATRLTSGGAIVRSAASTA